jgi:hypothetical protein
VRRREFIMLLGGAAASPLGARAQQGERIRRIGVLMHTTADEPASQARIAALQQGLQEAGWSVGRNLRIDTRWSGGDAARLRKDAEAVIDLIETLQSRRITARPRASSGVLKVPFARLVAAKRRSSISQLNTAKSFPVAVVK